MNEFVLPEKDRDAMLERMTTFLRACLPGKRVKVTIELYRKRRSDQQNRYLWGVCYATILREGGEALRGWTADDLHELFLGRHFGWEVLDAFGQKRKRPLRRSSVLSTVEFMEFVASIQQFASEQGVYIPDPNEEAA